MLSLFKGMPHNLIGNIHHFYIENMCQFVDGGACNKRLLQPSQYLHLFRRPQVRHACGHAALFQQQHPLGRRKGARLHAVQVYAAGNAAAQLIRPIPGRREKSRFQLFVHQNTHLLA